jgi:hypothetical protein
LICGEADFPPKSFKTFKRAKPWNDLAQWAKPFFPRKPFGIMKSSKRARGPALFFWFFSSLINLIIEVDQVDHRYYSLSPLFTFR